MTPRRAPNDLKIHDRTATQVLRNAQVVLAEVDDPYEPGGRIVVLRSTRHDQLADMLARSQIDQCDYSAGRHWQAAWENAEIGGVRAIDPSKEAVDGGRLPEVLTDRQRDAMYELKACRGVLGLWGDELIRDVLGRAMSLHQASASRGLTGEKNRKYVGQRFRECLSTLALHYGYANKDAEKDAAIREAAIAARAAAQKVHPELAKAIQLAERT
jgi:hypothetical protein